MEILIIKAVFHLKSGIKRLNFTNLILKNWTKIHRLSVVSPTSISYMSKNGKIPDY